MWMYVVHEPSRPRATAAVSACSSFGGGPTAGTGLPDDFLCSSARGVPVLSLSR